MTNKAPRVKETGSKVKSILIIWRQSMCQRRKDSGESGEI